MIRKRDHGGGKRSFLKDNADRPRRRGRDQGDVDLSQDALTGAERVLEPGLDGGTLKGRPDHTRGE